MKKEITYLVDGSIKVTLDQLKANDDFYFQLTASERQQIQTMPVNNKIKTGVGSTIERIL